MPMAARQEWSKASLTPWVSWLRHSHRKRSPFDTYKPSGIKELRSGPIETRKGASAVEGRAQFYLQPTQHMPTDGIVKAKAIQITKDANTDVEKARAIY